MFTTQRSWRRFGIAEQLTSAIEADGAAAGTSAGNAVGLSQFSASGASAGVAAGSAAGRSIFSANGLSAGASTVSADSGTQVSAVGSSSGTAAVNSVGSSVASAVGSSTGTSTAAAVGVAIASAVGAAVGASAASAIGLSIFSAVGAAAGTSTGTATGLVAAVSVGSSSGASAGVGVGRSTSAAVGSAAGSSTANAVALEATPGNVLFVGSGGRDQAAGNVNLEAPYPSSPVFGRLLVLRFSHITSGDQLSATYDVPGDWTFRFLDTQNNMRHWVYSKVADGTETGTVTITVTGGISGAPHFAAIDMYSGVDTTTNHGIYGGAFSGGNSATIADAGVTTTTQGALVVNYVSLSNVSTALGDFAGETGGTWTMIADGGDASVPRSQIATSSVNTGTIDGGSYDATASGSWIVRGFALAPALVFGHEGAAAGTSEVLGVGVCEARAVGASAGTSTAVGEAEAAVIRADGAAAGTSAAAAVGVSSFSAVGEADGSSTVAGDGDTVGHVAQAAGTSDAAAAGLSLFSAQGQAAGASSVSGRSQIFAESVGSAAGTSGATAQSRMRWHANGIASGQATVVGRSVYVDPLHWPTAGFNTPVLHRKAPITIRI